MTVKVNSLSIWDCFDKLEWSPHAAQELVLSSNARNRVVVAGRRFGKSILCGNELVPECLITKTQQEKLLDAGKRREFWIVGPTYQDSEREFRAIWNSLRKLQVPFDRPGSQYNPLNGDLHISCWKGTFQVHGKSAMHPEQLVGEGLNGVILSEAAKLKESIWIRFLRPMLADSHGWSIMSSTPEGRNWYFDVWRDGQDPNKLDWQSWKFPAWTNNFIYKQYTKTADVRILQSKLDELYGVSAASIVHELGLQIDPEVVALIEDLTTEAFNQEIAADFTDFVGRVFKNFDEELHVFDLETNPSWMRVACSDAGFVNPSVWLLLEVGPWGQVHVFDEIYQSGLTVPEFADKIKQAGLDRNVKTFYPDPASAGDNRQLENLLRIKSTGGTGGELKDRLDAIRKALKQTPQDINTSAYLPQLKINRRCVNTIREFGLYRYPEKRGNIDLPENPMKKDDHTIEALGRFFAGMFGTPSQQALRRRHNKANMNR